MRVAAKHLTSGFRVLGKCQSAPSERNRMPSVMQFIITTIKWPRGSVCGPFNTQFLEFWLPSVYLASESIFKHVPATR